MKDKIIYGIGFYVVSFLSVLLINLIAYPGKYNLMNPLWMLVPIIGISIYIQLFKIKFRYSLLINLLTVIGLMIFVSSLSLRRDLIFYIILVLVLYVVAIIINALGSLIVYWHKASQGKLSKGKSHKSKNKIGVKKKKQVKMKAYIKDKEYIWFSVIVTAVFIVSFIALVWIFSYDDIFPLPFIVVSVIIGLATVIKYDDHKRLIGPILICVILFSLVTAVFAFLAFADGETASMMGINPPLNYIFGLAGAILSIPLIIFVGGFLLYVQSYVVYIVIYPIRRFKTK